MFIGRISSKACCPQLLFPASHGVSSAVLVKLFILLHSNHCKKVICLKNKPLKHKKASDKV